MKPTLFLVAVLFGCSQEGSRDEGTVVGNPGDAAMRMAPVDAGEVITARTIVSSMSLESCDGTPFDLELDQEVDLLGDTHIEVPNGEWCGLDLFTEDGLYVEALSDEDELVLVLNLELEVLEFEAPEGFQIDGDQTVLEWGFPGWVSMDPELLLEEFGRDEEDLEDMDDREDMEEWDDYFVIEIDPDDAEIHDGLVDVFAHASGLYGDGDEDGEVSDEERDNALLVVGSGHPDHSTESEESAASPEVSDSMSAEAQLSTGPGCAKSESNVQWGLLFPLILLGWRRESGPR